jgi:hypothetical protein
MLNRLINYRTSSNSLPYFFRDTEIFSLAGMYEEWRHPDTKETIRTFSVLTVPANELCALIHNGGRNPGRMPAILPPEKEKTLVASGSGKRRNKPSANSIRFLPDGRLRPGKRLPEKSMKYVNKISEKTLSLYTIMYIKI